MPVPAVRVMHLVTPAQKGQIPITEDRRISPSREHGPSRSAPARPMVLTRSRVVLMPADDSPNALPEDGSAEVEQHPHAQLPMQHEHRIPPSITTPSPFPIRFSSFAASRLRASPSGSGCIALSIWGERGRKGTGSRALQKSLDRGARGGKSADQEEHAAIGRAADTEPGRRIGRVAACASGGARRFCPLPASRHHPRQEPSAVVPHAGICAGGKQ